MTIGYEQALAYLEQKDAEITVQQAERLRLAAQELGDRVAANARQLQQAREKAEELARAAGFAGGVAEMVKRLGLATIRQQEAELREVKKKTTVVRKPFMSPYIPDKIFSCAAHHSTPPELAVLLNAGWTKGELNYRNLAAACRARGIALTFDPIEQHAALAAKERQ